MSTESHEKVFELARAKTAEEIAHEQNRKIAPEIRRAVRLMSIPAAAKFLFDAILDDTFMFDFGGDGRGRLIASVRDLAKRYGHSRDSITKWAQILERKEVLWFDRCWPYQEWRVTAICPAPDHKANMIQKIKARASAKRAANNAATLGQSDFLAQNGKKASKADDLGRPDPVATSHNAATLGQSGLERRHNVPTGKATNGGQFRPHVPADKATLAGTSRPQVSSGTAQRAETDGIASEAEPVIAGQNSPLEKSPDVSYKTLESSKSVQRCNAFKKGGEKAFLTHVAEVLAGYDVEFAKTELTNSGAWWRMKYRQDPDKITRVLADLEQAIKDGKPFENNPGAYAVDLWKRFR